MRAPLDDAAAIEHEDFVGVDDRRQPMRDGQRRVVARDDFQLGLDRALGARVERGRRFVENQYRGALQDRARDRDALFFAARQLEAALADRRRVALRQTAR